MNKNYQILLLLNILTLSFLFIPNTLLGQMKGIKTGTKLDTILTYSADKILYLRKNTTGTIILNKNAILKYNGIILEADSIIYNLESQKVYSTFSQDTLFNGTQVDSIRRIGMPKLTEGSEIVIGDIIEYDLKENTGKIKNARTIVENSNPKDNTYLITANFHKHKYNDFSGKNAKISSCDLAKPHYHFRADSIIMTRNNWVYAKPITLYFSKVPVFWFPYILYKNQRGRQSGLIIPSYDYSSTKGNGLEHLGYYWYISSHIDYLASVDYYDHYGYLAKQRLRYKQIYKLDGEINTTFVNDHTSQNWKLDGFHNQHFSPTMEFKADYDFATSTSLVKKTGTTSIDRMKNQLNSSAEFMKTWYGKSDYLRITSYYKQYVDTGIVKYNFPNIVYNYSAVKPFSKNKKFPKIVQSFQYSGALTSSNDASINDDRGEFIHNVNNKGSFKESFKYKPYNLSINLDQSLFGKKHENKYHLSPILTDDTYLYQDRDSLYEEYAIKSTTELKLSYNHFKYFKTDYSFNYNRDYTTKQKDAYGNVLNKNLTRDYYSLKIASSTNIFGFFSPEIGNLSRIRHSISPSLSLSYIPDFTSDSYGYFAKDSIGNIHDKFRGSLIGSSPLEEQLLLSLSLRNIFDGKFFIDKTKTKNYNLINFNTDVNYNFVRDSNKLSDIQTTFNSSIYNGETPLEGVNLDVDFSGNFTLSPYDVAGKYLNPEFDFWRKNPFRLKEHSVKYSITSPFDFKLTIRKGKQWVALFNKNFWETSEETEENKEDANDKFETLNINKKSTVLFTDWLLNIKGGITFSEKFGRLNSVNSYEKSFYMNYTANFKPSENWEINYTASLNFKESQKLMSSKIDILRKMHCWQGVFEWDIFRKGFKLTINTTSDIFKDLKFDKDTRQSRW